MQRNLAEQPLYDRFHRAPREPLRTLAEMADEFGITSKSLASLLSRRGGPSIAINGQSFASGKKNYYKPSEMRKWWRDVNTGDAQ